MPFFRNPLQRSRLWFAFVGALACLFVAAAFSEPLLTLAEVGRSLALARGRDELPLVFAYRRAAGSPAATTQAATSSAPEVARRLAEAGARSGDVQITLSWNSVDDLDLHCYAPNGDHIYYGNRRVGSGGELDVDRNASPPFSREPIENIYWPSGAAPRGRYEIAVRHFRYHGGPTPTPFRVEVLVHGRRRTLTGTVPPRQTVTIHEFTVGRDGAEIASGEQSALGGAADNEAEFITPAPPPRPRRTNYLRAFTVTAAWTGALMALLPLVLTLAQRAYLQEPLLAAGSAGVAAAASLRWRKRLAPG
jgi:hypothetical protein